jgi:hypothetical protein
MSENNTASLTIFARPVRLLFILTLHFYLAWRGCRLHDNTPATTLDREFLTLLIIADGLLDASILRGISERTFH